MIKLPYGLADFHDLITEGYVYVDRTAHIRYVEDFGRNLVFIRPRRFGKSLWLNTLGCYYDLALAGERDRLFGRLAIGRDPTPLANRYFVLAWDFSLVDARGSVDEITARLWEHCNVRIESFLT
ncbi:MAG: AAA family ATPase, partial [Thermoanaerobaculia bacterium]